MDFTRRALEQAGFAGWVTFAELRSGECPRSRGVYVLTYDGEELQPFAEKSCGGWFKGRDPSVSEDVLRANWVDGAYVVYIGKANELRRRLLQFADFGAGKPVGHWGGRLIWHLPDRKALLVAWLETPELDPLTVEADLIALFRRTYGKPPFANDPHRLGS